jgi:hypothetical protein
MRNSHGTYGRSIPDTERNRQMIAFTLSLACRGDVGSIQES